ncbi:MAG: PilZ domain-containing protein [Fimbriimonadaceae bacterium]|nr:PilZ domain-containing protein [Fimbriimonadaceae bacterium]
MNQITETRDRRGASRFELLEYAIVRSNHVDEARSVVVDVSLGGLQLRSRHSFEAGTEVVVLIGRLGQDPIRIRGEVRYSVPLEGSDLTGTGVKVLPSSTRDRVAWADFVHANFRRTKDLLI